MQRIGQPQLGLERGQPVGSKALAGSISLSPASIRGVMQELEERGLLTHPHTSAGRVPTAKAYRYFVEQITGQTHLSPADEGLIRQSLAGISDPQEFLERTSHVLSLISSCVGVTIAATGSHNALDHVYFSRLADRKVLAVDTSSAKGVWFGLRMESIPPPPNDLFANRTPLLGPSASGTSASRGAR